MEAHALDRGLSSAFTSRLPYFKADRDRTYRLLLHLIRRAKEAGSLRLTSSWRTSSWR